MLGDVRFEHPVRREAVSIVIYIVYDDFMLYSLVVNLLIHNNAAIIAEKYPINIALKSLKLTLYFVICLYVKLSSINLKFFANTHCTSTYTIFYNPNTFMG